MAKTTATKPKPTAYREYMAENERKFSYQLRVLDTFSEEMLALVEGIAAKFEIMEFPAKARLIGFHTKPEHFAEASSGEVYVVDFKTRFPIPTGGRQMMAKALNLPESQVVLLSENDPAIEVETMISKFRGKPGKAALLDPENEGWAPVNHDEWYGNGFLNRVMREMQAAVKASPTNPANYLNKDGGPKEKAS